MTSFIDKLAWVYLVDRRVLCARSRGKDTYYLPGGKREGAETDQEALSREVREELGIELIPETITYFGQFSAQAHGKAEGTVVQMTCYTGQFRGEIQALAEVEEVAWLQYKDKTKVSQVTQQIFEHLKEQGLLA